MADDLQILRDLYAYDEQEWAPIRAEGTINMRFAAGDAWDPGDRQVRERANRLCLNADELGQYINQVVNEVRSNKRAVNFTPIGDGATDTSAQFYANKMREIEYRSRAQIAYTTAFENAVTRGYGFVRVNTRYLRSTSVNQDLWIDAVPDPNLITPDSTWQMPDLSDMGHCWVREAWLHDQFNKKWPKNPIHRFTSDLGKLSGDWVDERRVFVGEYWKVTTRPRRLLILQVPGAPEPVAVFADQVPKGMPLPGVVARERDVEDPSVVQQMTNGLEILSEHPWPGKYIPIVGCLGKVLYVSETGPRRREIHAMTQLARDPQKVFAYLWTGEVETVGLMTKFPYFAYEGQLSPTSLTNIARSNHEPIAVVEVKPWVEGLPSGTVLPFPQRNPWSLELGSLELAKESARRSIQAAMGQSPLPTSAQRRNEKSGIALKHIEESGERGSYHFLDHYLDMLTQVGIVCEDLIDKIYDSARDVGIRTNDDQAKMQRINDPADPKSVSTRGDHLVTVSTGPSFDSERDAGNEFAGDLLQSPLLPMLGEKVPAILAKAIKLKNLGPIGDQIAEIIFTAPPEEGQPQTPEQMQRAMAESQQQLQAMQQQLQQATQALEGKQVEAKGDLDKARLQAEYDLHRTELEISSRERIAQMTAEVKLIDIEASINTAVAEAMIAYEAQMQAQAQAEAHAREQSWESHYQALEQGAQGAAQTADRDAQAADRDAQVAQANASTPEPA